MKYWGFLLRTKYKFSGHQTFHFRLGWLEKGYNFACDQGSFGNDNAIVGLGVGKNMVESIKYWCELLHLVSDNEPTPFSHKLLGQSGWDSFLEDDASLWLLHWKLMFSDDFFTSGHAIFSLLHKLAFNRTDITRAIEDFLQKNAVKIPAAMILKRDIDCYLRVYSTTSSTAKNSQESFDCPMNNLSLITPIGEHDSYQFNVGSKSSLPPEIIAYAVCDYLTDKGRQSARIQEILYDKASPGQIFMLDENSLIEAIETLKRNPKWADKFDFTDSAGISLIYCYLDNPEVLLDYYYRKGSNNE